MPRCSPNQHPSRSLPYGIPQAIRINQGGTGWHIDPETQIAAAMIDAARYRAARRGAAV
jgi:hypothetical protein